MQNYQPNLALTSPETVWLLQVILIVLGHVVAVYLAHFRESQWCRTSYRAVEPVPDVGVHGPLHVTSLSSSPSRSRAAAAAGWLRLPGPGDHRIGEPENSEFMWYGTDILLHFFGPRYTLPISLALYLYAAAGIVVFSFVLVAIFAGDQVGAKALEYPRWRVSFLVPIARSPLPRLVGGTVGVLALLIVGISGLFGSTNPTRNPAQYLTWIYFWIATVIASGLVGNLLDLSIHGPRCTTRSVESHA